MNEFDPRQYIHTGGDVASPWRNGLTVAAMNHNTVMARLGHVKVSQVEKPNVITGPGPLTFCAYPYIIPTIPRRDQLTVKVKATTTGGTTYRIRATTSAGTSAFSAFTASGSSVSVNVDAAESTWDVVTVEAELNGAGNFRPGEVYIVQKPFTTTDLGTYESFPANPRHIPQDQGQYSADRALPVASMRDLLASQDEHFYNNVRTIVNQCHWVNHATIGTLDAGLASIAYNSSINTTQPLMEWIYWPRPGVKAVRVFVAARTDNYGSDGGLVSVGFRDGPSINGGFPLEIQTATSDFSVGNWAIDNELLRVPESPGPHYITLRGYAPGSGTTLYVQGVGIIEDPTWVE